MDKVNTFLGGGVNPLSTQIGQLIDRATDQMTPDANLEMYFEICDLINLKDENAKDAMKAIRKKMLTFSGKNWSVVLKLLLLIETCSNNCNKRFQVLLANKDFLQELKNMIGPKLNPPLSIQEKVLYLIQHWQTIFKNDADFKPIDAFYNELRSRGVDFPLYDPENTNSLDLNNFANNSIPDVKQATNTNQASYSKLTNAQSASEENRRSPPGALGAVGVSPPTGIANTLFQRLPTEAFNPSGTVVKLNEEQMAKLNSELDIVDSNVQVLNEILTELQSSTASSKALTQNDKDLSLLIELNKTCREMQKRITQLIGNISNENVIGELLRVNDDLNNVFLRYERFERTNGLANSSSTSLSPSSNNSNKNSSQKVGLASPASAKNKSEQPSGATAAAVEKPLIDFNDAFDDTVTKKPSNSADLLSSMKNMSLENKKATGDDEFSDMNAFLHDENEIKEMEEWLKSQGHKLNESSGSSNPSIAASSTKTSINKEDEANNNHKL